MNELGPAEIAHIIFAADHPSPPCSIELGLQDCAPPNASPALQAQILSEILMLMFLEGIKVKYGPNMTPEKLSPHQIDTLAQYVRSYGFYVIVRSDTLDETPPLPPPQSRGEARDLKDFHERFYDFERGMWHEIAFDFVPIMQQPPPAPRFVHKEI